MVLDGRNQHAQSADFSIERKFFAAAKYHNVSKYYNFVTYCKKTENTKFKLL